MIIDDKNFWFYEEKQAQNAYKSQLMMLYDLEQMYCSANLSMSSSFSKNIKHHTLSNIIRHNHEAS